MRERREYVASAELLSLPEHISSRSRSVEARPKEAFLDTDPNWPRVTLERAPMIVMRKQRYLSRSVAVQRQKAGCGVLGGGPR